MRRINILPILLITIFFLCEHILAFEAELPNKLRISSVQYPIEGNQSVSQIIKKSKKYIDEAKSQKSEIIVFPELIAFDAWPLDHKQSEKVVALDIARDVTPALIKSFSQLAVAQKIAILAGSFPIEVGGKIFNRSYFFFANGKFEFQDKLFLTPWEQDMGWTPGKQLSVWQTEWGRILTLICYDVELPLLSNIIAPSSPTIILVPSMTDSMSGLRRVRWTAQARAIEHHAYVVIAGTVDKTSKDWDNIGQAVVLSPSNESFDGEVLVGNLNLPSVIHAEISPNLLKQVQGKSGFVPARSQANRKIEIHIKDLKIK